MMNKNKSKKELDVDFIGGEKLTLEEALELKKYFAQQKASRKEKSFNKSRKSK